MKIINGKIVEATRDELIDYFLRHRDAGDSLGAFILRCKDNGIKIINGRPRDPEQTQEKGRRNEMSTTNALGKTKQRKKSKMCEMSADKVLQAIEDAKTGPDAFECVRHYARVKQHYANARENSPYFCDKLIPVDLDEERRNGTLADYQENVSISLSDIRAAAEEDAKRGELTWNVVLLCRMWEMEDAIAHDDTASAVDRCYAAIAVLLRTVDVLEGRQKLGKPEDVPFTETVRKYNNMIALKKEGAAQ